MRRAYVNCSVFIASFILVGCTSMRPLPLQEPTNSDKSDTLRNSRGVAKQLGDVAETLAVYRNKYYKTADDLRANDYTSSDVTFAGGIVGVLGGLAKSPETALAGGLLASGSSLVDKRYAYKVQAENYEKGGDAMHCMYKAFELSGASDQTHRSDTILKSVSDNIDNIRIKLRKSQAQVSLVSPSKDELVKAFSAEKDATDNKQQTLKLKEANQNTLLNLKNKTIQANQTLQSLQSKSITSTEEWSTASKKEKALKLANQNKLIQEKTSEIDELTEAAKAIVAEQKMLDEKLIDDNTKQLTSALDACTAAF